MSKQNRLSLDSITIDQELNARSAGLDIVTVAEYAERMSAGDNFPPIDVFTDGTSYWIVDGFHRAEAAREAGIPEINANVHEGDWRDAKLYSFGVNAEHGMRRTNADKRKAVTEMLEDEKWNKWSDREIARRCKVNHHLVASVRQEILTGSSPSETERTYRTKHGTISTMNTENIGKKDESDTEETGTDEIPKNKPEPVEEEISTEKDWTYKFVEPDLQKPSRSEERKKKTKPRFNIPPRTEEQKARDKTHNEAVIDRMVRLAGIVKYIEKGATKELVTFIYRDLAKLYHPDKQHDEKPEVAKMRAEAFSLIATIKKILEVSNEEYRELARSKGIIETKSSGING